MKYQKILYAWIILLFLNSSLFADDVTLDFEGLKNYEQVENFYNNGSGSKGSSKGLDYNITFSANTLALIDEDAGGSGNFANEPSPDTVFFFTGNDSKVYMNVEDGFTEGFSFYYTSNTTEGKVDVWTGLNAQGKKISTLDLEETPRTGKGDPRGTYDNWARKSLSFNGRAKSIAFHGVANLIGFDNVTLSPNPPVTIKGLNGFAPIAESTNTGYFPISHNPDSKYANQIEIRLAVSGKERDINFLCSKLSFSLKGDAGHGATLNNNGCNADDTKYFDGLKNDLLKLQFKVNRVTENGNDTFYFENGVLTICMKDKVDNCIDVMNGINVYTTDFNIKEDAFSFANGWTSKAKFLTYKDDASKYTPGNEIARYGMVIDKKLKTPRSKEFLWSSLGYFNYDKFIEIGDVSIGAFDFDFDTTGDGVCYGMAYMANSYFNNKNDRLNWGDTSTIKKWDESIDQHWKHSRFQAPYKPLKNKPHSYGRFNTEVVSKFLYGHMAQPAITGIGNSWVGSDIEIENKYVDIDSLKKNKATIFNYHYKIKGKESGHAVSNVGYIKWKKYENLVLYNNNTPDNFVFMFVENGKLKPIVYKEEFSINPLGNSTRDITKLHNVLSYSTSIHSNNFPYLKKQVKGALQAKNTQIQYKTPNHIKVSVVGATFDKITDENNKEVVLYPLRSVNLEKNKIYLSRNSIFYSYLLLPIHNRYKIKMKKDALFPVLKVFIKVPKSDQVLRFTNFDNIQKEERKSMVAFLTVGENDSDLSMKDELGNEILISTEELLELVPQPVLNLKSRVGANTRITWNNPVTGGYKETFVIKKEGLEPKNITDGTEVYRGSDESYVDTSLDNTKNKIFYYAAYTTDIKGNSSKMSIVKVNPYFYSLYGTLLDERNKPLVSSEVLLLDKAKLNIIGTDYSDKNGFFSFNNLLDGEYVLKLDNPSYVFEKTELNVIVENKSKEIFVKAKGLATLFMDSPQVIKVGESQVITWDGMHINEGAVVNIKLFRNNKWEVIASDIPYNQHSYKWYVTASKSEAKLKVELNEETFVENEVIILGADESKFDIDKDGNIDIDDIMIVVQEWNTKADDIDYKFVYDFNNDGVINIKDIMIIASKL